MTMETNSNFAVGKDWSGQRKTWSMWNRMKAREYRIHPKNEEAPTATGSRTNDDIIYSTWKRSPSDDLKLSPAQLKNDALVASQNGTSLNDARTCRSLSRGEAGLIHSSQVTDHVISNSAKSIQPDVVCVRDVSKNFGKDLKVLDRLDLTIKEGQIYGLLGASGCGKTTLLSFLVGLSGPDSGIVSVFGGTPGDRSIGIPGSRVGYMPQETALYLEFTIRESFSYFGRVHGMSKSDIEGQQRFLIELLDLPQPNASIANLSGGQQRRVSFAMSLLHSPELLILDEPTVGVDPMLRKSIWNYLLTLTGGDKRPKGTILGKHPGAPSRTTIIITTHYIEEAKQCSIVGMMSDGRLLAEDMPQTLLNLHNAITLEQVFLKLCIKQRSPKFTSEDSVKNADQDQASTMNRNGTFSKEGQQVYPGMTASQDDFGIQPLSYARRNVEKKPSMRITTSPGNMQASSVRAGISKGLQPPSPSRIRALVHKNVTKMKRNVSTFLFAFLLPAVQITLMCGVIGGDPKGLRFGVVNHEIEDPYDCDFTEGCDLANISCRYLYGLAEDSTFELYPFQSEDRAHHAAQQGEVWGVMTFGPNFTQALVTAAIEGRDASEEILNMSTIRVNIDMSNELIGYSIMRSLYTNLQNMSTTLLDDCDLDNPVATGNWPLDIGDPIFGQKSQGGYTQFMTPGALVMMNFMLAVSLTAQYFIKERADGVLHRSWVAGVKPIEIILAQVATQLTVIICQCAIGLVFAILIFGIKCHGPIWVVILLSILQGLGGMSFGLWVSVMFKDESAAIQFTIGSFFPLMCLSGILWPLEGTSPWLRQSAMYLPCTAAVQGMRDIMSRGWGITQPSVYLGVISSCVWLAVYLFFTWVFLRFKKW